MKIDSLVQVSGLYIGGIEAEISISQNTKKDRKRSTSGTSISQLLHPLLRDINILASTPRTDVKIAPKCLFLCMSAMIWHWVLFKGEDTEKIWKSKIYPPPLVLKRYSLERSYYNGTYFSLHTPYGVGGINVWKFSDRDPTIRDLSPYLLPTQTLGDTPLIVGTYVTIIYNKTIGRRLVGIL